MLAVSCSYDKTVKVWDVSGHAGKLVSAMSGHAGPVLELAVAPGGGQVLTGEGLGKVVDATHAHGPAPRAPQRLLSDCLPPTCAALC